MHDASEQNEGPACRCLACMLPMDAAGKTGYCSSRCLLWAFFGVPALKRGTFRRLQQKNARREKAPEEFEPPEAYPEAYGEELMSGEEGDFAESELALLVVGLEEVKRETEGMSTILRDEAFSGRKGEAK